MATTSPDSIYYPLGTDPVAPLNTVFATLASSVQTALNKRQLSTYRWTNDAGRTGQTGMQAGDTGYQVDTKSSYFYNGTAWIREAGTLIGSAGALRGNTAPVGTGVFIQTGNSVVSTNAGGDTTLTFPATFPNGLLALNVMSGDSSVGRFTVAVNGTGGNTAAVNIHIDREAGPLGGVSIRITWMAIGW